MTNRWITVSEPLDVGDLRFLVEVLDMSTGYTSHRLQESPLVTNQSHEARLHGWCGETSGLSRYARGVVQVVQVAGADRHRACVRPAPVRLANNYLARVGYPGLVGPAYAAIGADADGLRWVVWGLGETRDAATADAVEMYSRECQEGAWDSYGSVVTRVSPEAARAVERGTVRCSDLGIAVHRDGDGHLVEASS